MLSREEREQVEVQKCYGGVSVENLSDERSVELMMGLSVVADLNFSKIVGSLTILEN